jgi:hypothetical protein
MLKSVPGAGAAAQQYPGQVRHRTPLPPTRPRADPGASAVASAAGCRRLPGLAGQSGWGALQFWWPTPRTGDRPALAAPMIGCCSAIPSLPMQLMGASFESPTGVGEYIFLGHTRLPSLLIVVPPSSLPASRGKKTRLKRSSCPACSPRHFPHLRPNLVSPLRLSFLSHSSLLVFFCSSTSAEPAISFRKQPTRLAS